MLGMRRRRANDDTRRPLSEMPRSSLDPGRVDEHARLDEPQLHGGHEAVPAGQDARLVAVL